MATFAAPWQLDQIKKKKVDAYGRPIPETGGINTYPVGDSLVGFDSLTKPQQGVNDAFQQALVGGLNNKPEPFNYPAFDSGLTAPTPTPFNYPSAPPVGNPADVGTLQDMINSLNNMSGISPQVQETLNTLMQGANASPQQTLEQIIASIPTFGGELGGETQGALANALSGKFPEEYFQNSIAGPARAQFEDKTAPAIREEYAGPGTFWGTARAGNVTEEQGKMESNLAAVRGELGNQAQERALQAATISMNARQNQINMAIQELAGQRNYANTQQVTALNAAIAGLENEQNNQITAQNELNRLTQGKYQQIVLEQQSYQQSQAQAQQQHQFESNQAQSAYQFDQAQAQNQYSQEFQVAYDDYVKQNPGMTQYLQSALAYLNTNMLTTYQEYDPDASKQNAPFQRPNIQQGNIFATRKEVG